MAEAVYCFFHYCKQLGSIKQECPIKNVTLEAKGLNVDQVNEEEK